MSDKLVLQGSVYGRRVLKPYKRPDIQHSVIDGQICHRNTLTISTKNGGTSYYVYHAYDEVPDFSGRWYNLDMTLPLVGEDNLLTIPDPTNGHDHPHHVVIHLTPSGRQTWNRFQLLSRHYI